MKDNIHKMVTNGVFYITDVVLICNDLDSFNCDGWQWWQRWNLNVWWKEMLTSQSMLQMAISRCKDHREILDIWFDSHNQAVHVRREAPNCKDTKIVAANADSNEAANADSDDPLLLLDDSGSGKKDRASFQLPDNTVLPQCILS